MQGWIKSALANLQNIAGHLPDALGDGPAVHGFKRDDLQYEEVQRALEEIGWFAQTGFPQ